MKPRQVIDLAELDDSSDVDIVGDSKQDDTVSRKTLGGHVVGSTASIVGTNRLDVRPIEDSSDSDSDIEIVLPPASQARKLGMQGNSTSALIASSKVKRSACADPTSFTSASALLKEEQKRKSSSPVKDSRDNVALASTSKVPYTSQTFNVEATRVSLGNEPHAPLSSSLPTKVSANTSLARHLNTRANSDGSSSHSSASETEEPESPGAAFRQTLSKFQLAPAIRSSKRSNSAKALPSRNTPLFAPTVRSRPKVDWLARPSSSSSISVSADEKVAKKDNDPHSLLVIPTPYLAIISACPVCEDAWTTVKTAAVKLSHIRKCAQSRAYSNETVNKLVEHQVEVIHDRVEVQRQKLQDSRTLFESVVSKKGQEVQVVGVEKKNKLAFRKSASPLSGSDIENLVENVSFEAVLFTQGGSAHSQATSTQVQREIDHKIKITKKSATGILQPQLAQSITIGPAVAVSNGVGSKNWKKSVEILATSKKAASAQTQGTSGCFEPAPDTLHTSKLESYATSRFRLADKARQIAATRTVGRMTLDSDDEGVACISEAGDFLRPYRTTNRLSPSLVDQAAQVARQLPYSPWRLAGSGVDSITDRCVSPSSTSVESIASPPVTTHMGPSAPSPGPPFANGQSAAFSTSSSNGLSESSAALQALMNKLKLSKRSGALEKAKEEKRLAEQTIDHTNQSDMPVADESALALTKAARPIPGSTSVPGGIDALATTTAPLPTSPKRKKATAATKSDDDVTDDATSTPRRKSKKATKPAEADAADSSTPITSTTKTPQQATKAPKSPRKNRKAAPTMPDYASWDKEALQKETGKYGYKAAGTKKVLVEQLTRVWRVLHPETAELEPEGTGSEISPVPSPARATKKPARNSKEKIPGVKTSPTSRKKVASKKEKVESADGEDPVYESEDEVKTASERLREAVLADEAFYLRLLRYEPICFTTFEELAAKTNIKISKIALRDWLDSQAIIFYYPQDVGRNANRNGGGRRRK